MTQQLGYFILMAKKAQQAEDNLFPQEETEKDATKRFLKMLHEFGTLSKGQGSDDHLLHFIDMTLHHFCPKYQHERFMEKQADGKWHSKPNRPLQELWMKMFELVCIQSEGFNDFLGEIYETYDKNKSYAQRNGQFFTPPHIAQLMADIISIENKVQKSVADCGGCGSGRMLLAACKNSVSSESKSLVITDELTGEELASRKVFPYLYGVDTCYYASRIATINMLIQRACATIVQGDGLTGESFVIFQTYVEYNEQMKDCFPKLEYYSREDIDKYQFHESFYYRLHDKTISAEKQKELEMGIAAFQYGKQMVYQKYIDEQIKQMIPQAQMMRAVKGIRAMFQSTASVEPQKVQVRSDGTTDIVPEKVIEVIVEQVREPELSVIREEPEQKMVINTTIEFEQSLPQQIKITKKQKAKTQIDSNQQSLF